MYLLELDSEDVVIKNTCINKIRNEFLVLKMVGLKLNTDLEFGDFNLISNVGEFNLKLYFGEVEFDYERFLNGKFSDSEYMKMAINVEFLKSEFVNYFNESYNKHLRPLLLNLESEFNMDFNIYYKFICEIDRFNKLKLELGEFIIKFYFDKYSRYPFRKVYDDSPKNVSVSNEFDFYRISDKKIISRLFEINPKIFKIGDSLLIDSLEKLYTLNSLSKNGSNESLYSLNCTYHKDYNYVELDDLIIHDHLTPFFNIPEGFIDNLLELSLNLNAGKIIIDLSKFDFQIKLKYDIPENIDFYLIVYFDYRDFLSDNYSYSEAKRYYIYQTKSISKEVILGKLNIFPCGFQYGYNDKPNGSFNKEVNLDFYEYKNTITNLDESKINMKSFANFHYPNYKIENISCTYTPKINSNFTISPLSNELSIPVLIVNQFSENVNVLEKWLASDNLDDNAEYLNEEKSTLTNRELRDLNYQAYEQFDDEI
jgi:hypothetical protein